MDITELIRDWMAREKVGADRLLDSPAWRKAVVFGDADCVLRCASGSADDALWVSVRFDDIPCEIGIMDSATFPDLHRLWAKRTLLPREIVLALLERECGPLLQMLEDGFGRQLFVDGLVDAPRQPANRIFSIDGDASDVRFAFEPPSALKVTLAVIDNIDPAHEAVLGKRRAADVVYAEVEIPEGEPLEPGDRLVVPDGLSGAWLPELPDDGKVRILAAEPGELTFAELTGAELPPTPEPTALRVVRGTRTVARAKPSRLCGHDAVEIEGVTS